MTQPHTTSEDNLEAQDTGNTEPSATSEAEQALKAEHEALHSIAQALGNATTDDSAPAHEAQPEDASAARIAELEAQNAQLKDQLLRASAEAENIRKRAQREQADTAKYAVTNFAKDLISVNENLVRATASISEEDKQQSEAMKNLAVGVEMTLQELQTVFGKHHIKRIDPIGEAFDHNMHQAMLKVETDEQPEGTIVQVLQAGYVMHDRLLQPAMVGVAKPTAGADETHHVDTQA